MSDVDMNPAVVGIVHGGHGVSGWFTVRLASTLLTEQCHIDRNWALIVNATMACLRRFLDSSGLSSCLHVEDDDIIC